LRSVRLVEVVDVEDQTAVGVHVRAEVLRVQVAVGPHAGRPLVQVGSAVLLGVQIVVEEARRTPVEREGRGRHLPELHAERGRVGGQELAEGGVEDGEDLLTALLVVELGERHRGVPPGT
jgi:hypothetical protein